MGVDSSGRKQDWVKSSDGVVCMSYPAGEQWGAVFITVGPPVDGPRPWKDYTNFNRISVDLKGKAGGELLSIGIKDAQDADDGSETKVKIPNIPQEWKTYTCDLTRFKTADRGQLYVVLEFVFDDTQETVYFRNIKYSR